MKKDLLTPLRGAQRVHTLLVLEPHAQPCVLDAKNKQIANLLPVLAEFFIFSCAVHRHRWGCGLIYSWVGDLSCCYQRGRVVLSGRRIGSSTD